MRGCWHVLHFSLRSQTRGFSGAFDACIDKVGVMSCSCMMAYNVLSLQRLVAFTVSLLAAAFWKNKV